ncbi:hypothetical protein JOF41_000189 [Saccharothrix coeruleofusca]|uniref:hypothetical protein n=1 Tax=Saccharothrix coeruleofusca TaxID=33919 RepID=UPI001AEB014D|nr:hypothetical protein [Saccharothrix coeruleofusca]MBP2334011.1 hypothetical protein [Saccharothrix coeruleofusca]
MVDGSVVVMIAFAVLAVAALLIAAGVAADRKYRATVSAWAAAQGWRYREGGGGPWTACLPRGDARKVRLQVEGFRHYPVTVAHYQYDTTSTSSKTDMNGQSTRSTSTTTHHLTVHVVHLPFTYPPIAVRRRGLGSRIARGAGYRDGKATGDEEFDRRFRVRVDDPAVVPALITPALVRAHLDGVVPEWSLAGADLVSTSTGRIRVESVFSGLDPLLRVADLLVRR